jgi:alkanesulfonate monooxygenase SsuD/methylene tetrahydromethanopterin reductase-like flavin-dependent oxidoreductase (luciferase family)
VLPDLIAGKPTVLADGVEATLAPGSTVPPIVVAGNGRAAFRRAARYGDGWATIAMSPEEIKTALEEINRLAADNGRPAIRATVVAPQLDTDPLRAADQLAAYDAAGTQRVIIAPSGDWRRDYEHAAKLRAALHTA